MIEQAIQHLSKDTKMKLLIDTVALDYHWQPGVQGDVYARMLRALVGQQVSVKAAEAIHQRFLNLFGDGYPHVEQLLEFDLEHLRSAGLSKQKANYVQNVAQFFSEHQLFENNWSSWSNEAIMKELTQIKGIGEWTVEMILMFCLNRGDILPLKDLAIQNTMIRLYEIEETKRALAKRMTEIGKTWQPYRTLACYYLWSWKHRW